MNILSVTLSANEPIAGWGDNLYGPIGSTISTLLGFTRFQWCDPDITANLVPVDFTVHALIASAWDVSNQYRYNQTYYQETDTFDNTYFIFCHKCSFNKLIIYKLIYVIRY